jgi:hypothetical protein
MSEARACKWIAMPEDDVGALRVFSSQIEATQWALDHWDGTPWIIGQRIATGLSFEDAQQVARHGVN